jgi:hypothetical protein
MKKIFLFVLMALLLPLNAQSHPPTTVEIDYTLGEGQLYVYMDHLSRDHRKHYIRKTVIFVNGEEVATESNRQQTDPNTYAFSVGLEAKETDTIMVKAYSTEGGVAEGSVVVQKSGGEGSAGSGVKAKVEAYKNKDRSVDVYGSQEKAYK